MEAKNVWALVLIICGAYFLSKNLNILPRLGVIWPLVLIVLGSVALYQAFREGKRGSSHSRGQTWEIKGGTPFLRTLIALGALLVVGFGGLIILGILGPFFLWFLFLLPALLFFRLGFAFLKVLLPIGLLAAPLLLIIWILSWIF